MQASAVDLGMHRSGSTNPSPLPQPSRRTSKLQSVAPGTQVLCFGTYPIVLKYNKPRTVQVWSSSYPMVSLVCAIYEQLCEKTIECCVQYVLLGCARCCNYHSGSSCLHSKMKSGSFAVHHHWAVVCCSLLVFFVVK